MTDEHPARREPVPARYLASLLIGRGCRRSRIATWRRCRGQRRRRRAAGVRRWRYRVDVPVQLSRFDVEVKAARGQ